MIKKNIKKTMQKNMCFKQCSKQCFKHLCFKHVNPGLESRFAKCWPNWIEALVKIFHNSAAEQSWNEWNLRWDGRYILKPQLESLKKSFKSL